MKCNYVHVWLSTAYGKLGRVIGRRPLWFIVVPVILTGLVSLGLLRLTIMKDLEFLITPSNGRSKTEREAVESIFPPDADEIDILRLSRFPRYGWIIMEARDGGSMLRESIMDDVALLDQRIRNAPLIQGNSTFKYEEICQRSYDGECFFNPVLNLRGKMSDVRRGAHKIKYPVEVDDLTFYVTVYAYNLGGVTRDEDGYVRDVKALRLFYNLESNTPEKMKRAEEWEDMFLDIPTDNYESIFVYKLLKKSWDEETSKVTEAVLPMLVIAIVIMIIFAAVSCMTSDWRISKPVVGICGAISSGMGILFAFAFLQLCGATCADLTIGVPFLMLGVGMDDAFVLLAAWRITDPKKSVEKRMQETYSEAALSVTITSLTNFVASCIGLTTPYGIIRVYCLHMALSVLFVYLIQITFYGGCLSLSGYTEKKNLNTVLRSSFKCEKNNNRLSDYPDSANIKEANFFINTIFEKIGKILTYKIAKFSALCIYLSYLFTSFYFAAQLETNFRYSASLPYYSYATKFMDAQYSYFREYPLSVQVVINQTLDYSDPDVQSSVNAILTEMTDAPNMGGTSLMDSWLHQYLRFAREPVSGFTLRGFNLSDPEDFIQGFKIFVRIGSARRYSGDVIFNENGTRITASRFILQCTNLTDAFVENRLIKNLWRMADSAKYHVYVHNLYFFLYDINSELFSTTVQCLYISALLIIVIYLAFVTDIVCAICISVTIISVEIGLLGFMTLWNVPLNVVSMICLVLSVGFCVDYSAHVCYVYVNNPDKDANVKLQSALRDVGYPVFQGCLSTVLGVIVLSRAPADVFVVFFKIIFLVMIFSFVHGVILLPLVLNTCDHFLKFLRAYTKRFCNTRNSRFNRVPQDSDIL